MTVSNFNMKSKGAANMGTNADSGSQHDFTYVVADEAQTNFHAFFDEHESWINHRDNGKALNVDSEMVGRLLPKVPSKDA